MGRLGAIFVAICMVLIAGSSGAVLYLQFGLSGAESAIVATAALTSLALYNAVSTRVRDRGDFGEQIAHLARGTADLARQVAEISRRIALVEGKAGAAVDKTLAATQPLAAEIGELGTLVKQLAETVVVHDAALSAVSTGSPAPAVEISARPSAMVSPLVAADIVRTNGGQPGAALVSAGSTQVSGPFKGMEPDAVVAIIREAIEAHRVDIYLQPIVTLPQRKVRYYEAVARLRTAEGEVVPPADFLSYAESGGLMPKIDNLMLFRSVQVVRRLLAKNREIGVFCNVSASTLVDPEFFPQFTEFMEANRAIAPALIFEFMQSAYRSMGPIETESLDALADQGFRFSMDHVADLQIEPRDLAERRFRFIKVPAALLLNRNSAAACDIHPADFAGLLSRFGVELIAVNIESETVVVDLLDYDVKYGQGFLFSPPRPVRPEIMQGIADRNHVVARDPAVAGAPPGAVAAPPPATRNDARPAASQRASALAQLARS